MINLSPVPYSLYSIEDLEVMRTVSTGSHSPGFKGKREREIVTEVKEFQLLKTE